ncbi:retrovirus-related pol polyprotein from transposon TNT 1-94 [Tanacetum coccineum]
MSTENKAHFQSEKEEIFLLLTGIGDEICKTANEMWIAIERLQQGESLNIQDVKTNLFWEIGKLLLEMESQWSLITLVNEIRAERIAKSANPLALVAAAQQYPKTYHQAPKPQKAYAPAPKQSSFTRSNASTRHKGKEIAKPITPPSESEAEEDSDPEQAQKDKEINKNVDTSPRYVKDNQAGQFGNQRTLTVAGARETVGSQIVQQNGIQCFNCKEFGHFAKECRKPKRVKDYTYHKEKMLCKQAEKGVPLQAEQADWLEDTDEEIDEQELKAHYSFMAKIQEVLPAYSGNDAKPLEKLTIFPPMKTNKELLITVPIKYKYNRNKVLRKALPKLRCLLTEFLLSLKLVPELDLIFITYTGTIVVCMNMD